MTIGTPSPVMRNVYAYGIGTDSLSLERTFAHRAPFGDLGARIIALAGNRRVKLADATRLCRERGAPQSRAALPLDDAEANHQKAGGRYVVEKVRVAAEGKRLGDGAR